MTSFSSPVAVIPIGPTLDYRTTKAFLGQFQECIRSGARHLVLDFEKTRVLDSSGVGVLALVHRALTEAGGTLVLAAVRATVHASLQAARVHSRFRRFESIEAAVAAAAPACGLRHPIAASPSPRPFQPRDLRLGQPCALTPGAPSDEGVARDDSYKDGEQQITSRTR